MNSAPHLLTEDRPMYERVLDEALRTAPDRPELAALGQRLNAEQLRTMALNAAAVITTAAASEYHHYVQVREELRYKAIQPESSNPAYTSPNAASASAPHARPPDRRASTGPGHRLARAVLGAGQSGGQRAVDGVAPQRWAGMSYGSRLLAAVIGLRVRPVTPTMPGARTPHTPTKPSAVRPRRSWREAEPEENTEGAGVLTVTAVLAPVLAGCAAAIFFLVGLLLTMLKSTPALAESLVTAGWVFTALTGASVLGAVTALVLTALRNGSESLRESTHDGAIEEVDRAREAWATALLERGILPFLREALADPSYDGPRPSSQQGFMGHMPQLGYNRPGFSSPEGENTPTGARPSLSSPDFSSPDFGGPEHQPD
ncbi:hypothetical protein ACIRO1_45450 [Streptomyces sp. NPDC102381]|uniref:hypothetical protein n=1 Tax=Streptomyces sp. NPDC102381 TaxID=3366164 RepID=UPI003803D5E5